MIKTLFQVHKHGSKSIPGWTVENYGGNWRGVGTDFNVYEVVCPEQPVLDEPEQDGLLPCAVHSCTQHDFSSLLGVMGLPSFQSFLIIAASPGFASALPQAHVSASHLCPALVGIGICKKGWK